MTSCVCVLPVTFSCWHWSDHPPASLANISQAERLLSPVDSDLTKTKSQPHWLFQSKACSQQAKRWAWVKSGFPKLPGKNLFMPGGASQKTYLVGIVSPSSFCFCYFLAHIWLVKSFISQGHKLSWQLPGKLSPFVFCSFPLCPLPLIKPAEF